jgi:hypothetical protein
MLGTIYTCTTTLPNLWRHDSRTSKGVITRSFRCPLCGIVSDIPKWASRPLPESLLTRTCASISRAGFRVQVGPERLGCTVYNAAERYGTIRDANPSLSTYTGHVLVLVWHDRGYGGYEITLRTWRRRACELPTPSTYVVAI